MAEQTTSPAPEKKTQQTGANGSRVAIIAFEDDVKIHRALAVASNIDFYTYKISFKLDRK